MDKATTTRGIGTTIYNLAARLVMIPYNGTPFSLHLIASVVMVIWLFFINTYNNWNNGIIATLAIFGITVVIMTIKVFVDKADWLIVIPSVAVIAVNSFYYDQKIDHRILHDLLPMLIYATIATRNLFWITISLCFFWGQSGFAKAWHGWLDTETQSAFSHLLFYHLNDFSDRAGWFFQELSVVAWEVLDWLVVLFELSFILAFFVPRALRVLIPIAVLFHAGVWLMFDINYFFMLPIYLFLFLCFQE